MAAGCSNTYSHVVGLFSIKNWIRRQERVSIVWIALGSAKARGANRGRMAMS